jgi:hypothetical protein
MIARMRRCIAALLAAASFFAAPALAQTRDPAAVAEARTLYAAGLEAVGDGRWSDALAAFRRSYELSGAPPALFNAGLALRALGRAREARDVFAEVLDALPAGESDARREAEAMLIETAARVGHLSIEEVPPVPDVTLHLDGAPVEGGGRSVDLEIDAGDHAIIVTAPGHRPFEWRGSVTDGGRVRVRVVLEAEAIDPVPWILVGTGAAVAIAVAIIVGVVVASESEVFQLTSPMRMP